MAQINCLAQHFASSPTKFTAVFSSDLSRARITAECICRAQVSPKDEVPLKPVLARNLREKDFGSMECRVWKAAPPTPLPSDWTVPESRISMRHRAKLFFDEYLLPLLMRDLDGQHKIAVVAHGLILQELWSHLIELFVPADSELTIPYRRPMWSNTGYMTVLIRPKATEKSLSPVPMPGFAVVVLGVDDKKHLVSLRRTGGGLASAAHDRKQRKIDQFFR
jgi:probable phosphoglycerate mutase